ncbi:MAG: type II toxin-antitoxin system RelE/ParE family toxin [Spirochaetota bacterium]
MKISIDELANKEFNDAIDWYENQSEGLGKRFKKAVITQIKKIIKNPNWFLIEADNIYKAYIPKFPYKILFSIDKDMVTIWAIAHMHRKPWYWQSRK